MALYQRVAGVWKEVTQPSFRVSGVWKEVRFGYVRVSGVWKRFYTRAVILVAGASISDTASGTAFASLSIESDGTISKTEGVTSSDIANWITPTSEASSDYDVRATLSSGSTPTGTLNTWLGLGSTRSWSILQSGAGTTTCQLLIEIREGSTVLDSGTYTLTAIAI